MNRLIYGTDSWRVLEIRSGRYIRLQQVDGPDGRNSQEIDLHYTAMVEPFRDPDIGTVYRLALEPFNDLPNR